MDRFFSPVWLSTDAQLAALAQAHASAPLLSRLFGRWPVPQGCAHLRGVMCPWMRRPLAMLAQGELGFYRGSLVFKQMPFKAFGWRVVGQHDKLSFSLEAQDVVAIDAADLCSPAMKHVDLPMTRLRTNCEGIQRDVLLCVGGQGPAHLIKARSLALRQALLDWHDRSRRPSEDAAVA